jgi:hypothetical protein
MLEPAGIAAATRHALSVLTVAPDATLIVGVEYFNGCEF